MLKLKEFSFWYMYCSTCIVLSLQWYMYFIVTSMSIVSCGFMMFEAVYFSNTVGPQVKAQVETRIKISKSYKLSVQHISFILCAGTMIDCIVSVE